MRVLASLQLTWTHPLIFELEEERKAFKAKAEAEWAAEEADAWSEGDEY